MNVNDSEYLTGQLEEMGYISCKDMDKSDLIILNTCCVREKVEQKIYSAAGRIAKIKKKRPEIIFGICGCLAQKEKDILARKIPFVDLVFGPSQITNFVEIITHLKENKIKEPFVLCNNSAPLNLKNKPVKHQSSITAFIQIMKGCNNFCSYCIVPYTRGPEESRPVNEIVEEIEILAENNYKEVMLLGQNVNSYGFGLKYGDNFLTLLSKVNDIKGIERIR